MAEPRPARKWLWFVGLWGASVLALTILAKLIRLAL